MEFYGTLKTSQCRLGRSVWRENVTNDPLNRPLDAPKVYSVFFLHSFKLGVFLCHFVLTLIQP